MADSLEEQQFKSWLRRPTLFIANAWYLLSAAGQTIIAYLMMGIIQLIGLLIPDASVSPALTLSVSTFYEIAFLALPVIWYTFKHEGVDQSIRLNPPRFDMMIYAIAAAVIGVPLSNCVSIWWMLIVEGLGGRLYSSSVPIPTDMDSLISTILLVGVIPGICEELMFRGGLMGAWERRGTKKAVLITSVLFALLHGTILGLPVQLLMGLVLGFVLIVSDSLYVSMAYHTVHNSLTIFISYLSLQLADSMAGAESLTTAEYLMLSGGFMPLITETALLGSVFGAVLYMMLNAQRRRKAKIIKIDQGDTSKMGWQELLVLLAGLVTVGAAYAEDFLYICGVI